MLFDSTAPAKAVSSVVTVGHQNSDCEGQGSALVLEDVAYAEHAVEHLVTVPLS
jgi:hypothetical protein